MKYPSTTIIPNPVLPIRMSRHVLCRILCSVGARPAESGGILLGPIGSDRITDFYLDSSADCTGVTYTPDHLTLGRKMKDQWLPSGLDFKGFVHSHPGTFDQMSVGDLVYVRRILEHNPDMAYFAAPIVIPQQFRLRPIIVLRDTPTVQRATALHLF